MKKVAKEITDEMTGDEFQELIENIEKITALGKKIQASRLAQRTIILLLHDITKLPKSQIRFVLNALPELNTIFLKPKKKSKK